MALMASCFADAPVVTCVSHGPWPVRCGWQVDLDGGGNTWAPEDIDEVVRAEIPGNPAKKQKA